MHHELKIKTERSKKFLPAKCITSEAPEDDREFSCVYSYVYMQTMLFRQMFLASTEVWTEKIVAKDHSLKPDRSPLWVSLVRLNETSSCINMCAHEIFCSSRSILIEQCSSLWKTTKSSKTVIMCSNFCCVCLMGDVLKLRQTIAMELLTKLCRKIVERLCTNP